MPPHQLGHLVAQQPPPVHPPRAPLEVPRAVRDQVDDLGDERPVRRDLGVPAVDELLDDDGQDGVELEVHIVAARERRQELVERPLLGVAGGAERAADEMDRGGARGVGGAGRGRVGRRGGGARGRRGRGGGGRAGGAEGGRAGSGGGLGPRARERRMARPGLRHGDADRRKAMPESSSSLGCVLGIESAKTGASFELGGAVESQSAIFPPCQSRRRDMALALPLSAKAATSSTRVINLEQPVYGAKGCPRTVVRNVSTQCSPMWIASD